ncbi:MarR family winged helix-turn-helix transcriptional regulator [Frondihabitans sp. VKM Ac-2883]|uniref:MarR family winged helix-turn-helix transcriptional regulator n=1 Tax=Frondihabitans sp. VKM Ac-2883 TaxID=2783823 RepID=UPI00188B860E|nr:MarR family transcriptional regulator [Frondihabitans sp. VKM Ac-2883]MBF4577563.1 MarR family transcriptional regulator [Frondihabitans sp. VKM Ac-2883]
MEVNSAQASSPAPPRSDREDRTAARRDGRPLPDGDLRARVQQIAVRQQRFERHLAAELDVDRAGLETMDYLISVGPTTPTQIAQHLGISTAAMTLVLNRLETAGHIIRGPHPSDRRKLMISASDSSSGRAHDYVTPLIEDVEVLIESLTDTDRAVIESFLDRLIGIYDYATPPPHGSGK